MSIEARRARREDAKMMKRLIAISIVAFILFGWSVIQLVDTVKFIKHSQAERATYSYLLEDNKKEL